MKKIIVSTVYRSGTSLGYGTKVGKMVLATDNGNVNCEFKGYTYYIGLRRGDRVQVEGEFSEHMEEERRERVF
ncbi:MAG: hypothetical protein KIH09_16350, partial [Candidatus Freyarchaeota archaeon]|nr:hypothetical protein [Candidatus Jordarchaeia archaeon]